MTSMPCLIMQYKPYIVELYGGIYMGAVTGGKRAQSELRPLRVITKPWLGHCNSRFRLPLSLTSSTLRAQLPFAVS